MRNDAYVSKWKIIKSMEHFKDEENKLHISNMFHHSSSVSVTSPPLFHERCDRGTGSVIYVFNWGPDEHLCHKRRCAISTPSFMTKVLKVPGNSKYRHSTKFLVQSLVKYAISRIQFPDHSESSSLLTEKYFDRSRVIIIAEQK